MERWKKCVEFHGHECGGLAIGYKAAQYAEKLLNLTFSDDEQVICIYSVDFSCKDHIVTVILQDSCSIFPFECVRLTGQSNRLLIFKKGHGQTLYTGCFIPDVNFKTDRFPSP